MFEHLEKIPRLDVVYRREEEVRVIQHEHRHL